MNYLACEECRRSTSFNCGNHYRNISIPSDWIKERVQWCRIDQPELCWRPNSTWQNVCILDLGHEGCCGWENFNG